jgi:tetratricopeptide (TPR) repeat protein
MILRLLFAAASVFGALFAQSAGEVTELEACEKLIGILGRTEGGGASLAASLPGGEKTCMGVILNNMAAAMSLAGHMAEAEILAQRALSILETSYPPGDLALLRPLQILAGARLAQGKTARAREALRKMESIRIERPQDRALIHGMTAAVLQVEGKLKEAEREYLAAIRWWEATASGDTADVVALLTDLGSLYIKRGELDQARQALDRARAVLVGAKDSTPIDQINLLTVRALLHAKRHEWPDAEENLRHAISIADRQARQAGTVLAPVLESYAFVLRKIGRIQEARAFERRASALHDHAADAVVDVSELLAKAKTGTRIRK